MSIINMVDMWSHFSGGYPVTRDDAETARILASPMAELPPLSAGQTQLFVLARAVMRLWWVRLHRADRRPILLLDEATSALDEAAELRFHGIVQAEFLARGHTVVSISHSMTASRGRGTVVTLQDGVIVQVKPASRFVRK